MSSPFRSRSGARLPFVIALVASVAGVSAVAVASRRAARVPPVTPLRVCADPNNLPFSNDRREGLENRIVEMVAHDLGREPVYVWHAQRRGFVRETLDAGRCDVIAGVPTSFERALVTRPYYRSTYVFVSRRDGGPHVRSFNDERLRRLTIGVHLIGDDGANTPPVHALTARGIVGNLRGYMIYGDYAEPAPPARLIEAVARGDVDIGIAWGPLAGYFAPKQAVPLELTAVSPQIDLPFLPFVFDIGMGVRGGDSTLRAGIDRVLARRKAEIDRVLDQYGVPRVGPRGTHAGAAATVRLEPGAEGDGP